MIDKVINKENYFKLPQEFSKRCLMMAFGMVISSFGMTLLIKSNLGQSTVSGISYNIGIVLNMKTGTVLALINYACFIGQIIVLKREFKVIHVLQLLITTVFGSMVNLFLYNVAFIANMQLANYGVKLFLLG